MSTPVRLGDDYVGNIQCLSGGGPIMPDAAPEFRVYGPDNSSAIYAGQAVLLESGVVANITAYSPSVRISSPGHGLTSGQRIQLVNLAGSSGTTALNSGYYTITKIDDNTFDLAGTSVGGSPTYTPSSGSWKVAGLYKYTVPCTTGNGFERGKSYRTVITGTINGGAAASGDSFNVV